MLGRPARRAWTSFLFQEPCLGGRHALGRDRGHLLAGPEHLRRPGGHVLEEAVQRGEPLVAAADVVAAFFFQVSQERQDLLEGEVLKGQAGDLAPSGCGGEQQQEPDRVAVAAHRGGAQSPDRDQVIGEVGVQDRAERLGLHDATAVQAGSARASKRRLACSSSAGVMVR